MASMIDNNLYATTATSTITIGSGSNFSSSEVNVGFRGGKIPPITVSALGYICIPDIKNVIFNPPATIVFWVDGTKTVVKCMQGREFDKWEGLSMAICKKLYGKRFKRTFKKWCGK